MSDTPRTDAKAVFPGWNDSCDTSSPEGTHVDSGFARELERENARLKACGDHWQARSNTADHENMFLRDALENLHYAFEAGPSYVYEFYLRFAPEAREGAIKALNNKMIAPSNP